MVELKLVLDSNEYIFYLNNKSNDILRLLDSQDTKIFLNDLIFEEVIRNITKEAIKYSINLLKNPKFEVIAHQIPENLTEKYKNLGLKKGDIVIAAFCEAVGADYLITENRHFLKSRKFGKFKVLSLKGFLNKFE